MRLSASGSDNNDSDYSNDDQQLDCDGYDAYEA
jgi:hypothetical protein